MLLLFVFLERRYVVSNNVWWSIAVSLLSVALAALVSAWRSARKNRRSLEQLVSLLGSIEHDCVHLENWRHSTFLGRVDELMRSVYSAHSAVAITQRSAIALYGDIEFIRSLSEQIRKMPDISPPEEPVIELLRQIDGRCTVARSRLGSWDRIEAFTDPKQAIGIRELWAEMRERSTYALVLAVLLTTISLTLQPQVARVRLGLAVEFVAALLLSFCILWRMRWKPLVARTILERATDKHNETLESIRGSWLFVVCTAGSFYMLFEFVSHSTDPLENIEMTYIVLVLAVIALVPYIWFYWTRFRRVQRYKRAEVEITKTGVNGICHKNPGSTNLPKQVKFCGCRGTDCLARRYGL
jgi:hypothetical protein